MSVIYLDTETTGVAAWAEIVEIAIVGADGRVLLSSLVRPSRGIPPSATAVHGITTAMVRTALQWHEIAPKVRALIDGATMVAHGAAFDKRMLRTAGLGLAGTVCTLRLCRKIFGKPMKLSEAAALAGHVADGAWHRATADALACRTVHRWLLTQQANKAAPALALSPPAASRPAAAARPRFELCTQPDDPRLVRLDRALCPEPTLRGAPWTEDASSRLAALWQDRVSVPDILAEMPRTPVGIFAQLQKLGLISETMNPYRDSLRR